MSSITGDKLAYLTYTGLQLVKILSDNRILIYDTNHKRQEIIVITDELEEAKKYIDLGWKKKKVLSGIVLMAPENYLVDLADPFKVEKSGGIKETLCLYKVIRDLIANQRLDNFIKKVIKKSEFSNLDIKIIEGSSLETEVRIVGSDNRLENAKEEIISLIRESRPYKIEMGKINSEWPDPPRKIQISEAKISASRLSHFEKIFNFYHCIDRDFSLPVNVYGCLNDLPASDYYILVPHSGFKFLDTLERKVGMEKICFFERHYSRDGNFWLFKKNFKNKKVLIADISYSGTTLGDIAEMVSLEGGKPIKVAVWPKSRTTIANSDYILFLDKLIPANRIDINEVDWPVSLYKKLAFQDRII